MALTRILLWLGNACMICAGLLLLAGLSGFLMLDVGTALRFVILAAMVGSVGLILILTTFNTPARESNAEAMLFLCLFWLLCPAIFALPFWATGASEGFLPALFEGVSAFTTTGATRLDPKALPPTLIFYRALLQWFGGVSVATFAIIILAALNVTGIGIHRSMLFTLQKGELFGRLLAVGKLVAGIYLFLSACGFILMLLGGAPAFEALCLSLSGISTGGMTPRAGPLSLYIPPFAATVLGVICVLGAMNIAIIWDFLRARDWRNFYRLFLSVEHRALLVVAAFLVLAGLGFAGLQNIGPLMLDALFFASSTGFRYDVVSLDMTPPVILISLSLIGGSALSTAGGVKLIRMLLLFRHLGTELSRLSHPSRVIPVQFRSRTIPDQAFVSVWMYFFAYSLVFGLGIAALGAVGLAFEDSVTVSAASLSNMGPLLGMTLPESGLTYAQFSPWQMVVSIVLMLIGRIEIMGVMALFLPAFWRQ